MIHRSRSRDSTAGDATPRAAYFSKQQTADYLSNLRNNRPARPVGSRPPPNASPTRVSSTRDDSHRPRNSTSSRSSYDLNHSRSSSVLSYYQGAGSISSGRSSPEKMFYAAAQRDMEQRESEKQEATRMRTVLARPSPKRDTDSQLHLAAQQEAAELIWKHQNPDTPYRVQPSREKVLEQQNPYAAADYDYPVDPADYDNTSEHTQQDATPVPTLHHAQSPERSPSKRLSNRFSMSRMSAKRRSISSLRNVSGTIKKAVFPNSREQIYEDNQSPGKTSSRKAGADSETPSHVRRNPFARAQAARQNQQAGFDRADVMKSLKTINSDRDKQRWNPDYTASPSPTTASPDKTPNETDFDPIDQEIRYRDGIEIRADDIRAATSMRRQDRSTRLPSPTVISDNPNCPIVSFDNGWKPREPAKTEDTSLARSQRPQKPERATSDSSREGVEPTPHSFQARASAESSRVARQPPLEQAKPDQGHAERRAKDVEPRPYEQQPGMAKERAHGPARSATLPNSSSQDQRGRSPQSERSRPGNVQAPFAKPTRSQTTPSPGPRPISPRNGPSVDISSQPKGLERRPSRPNVGPSIQVSEPASDNSRRQSRSALGPSVQVSEPRQQRQPYDEDVPRIQTSESHDPRRNPRGKTESVPSAPSISVSDSVPASRGARQNPQELPQPRPDVRHTDSAPAAMSRGHWTPTARSNGALCAQCALPISGRIVTAAGTRFHPECFICYHCSEALECVAFYPEPGSSRAERLERIDRRMAGEHVEPPKGLPLEEDDDDALRFYCHLDYHEFFSPRCKHCKTPIEGEVIVACGAEWHAGHFFCAECGDPFSPQIPFVEKEGYAWCINCHQNRSSTRCKTCKKPVTDMVLKALGADWHDECFRCFECDSTFSDGKFFLRGQSQDPVCSGCEARRLKA